MNLKDKARKLKVEIPAIFIALGRKYTPFLAKIFGIITVGYALSPIDLIPDFIPVLGYLDDLLILPILVMLTVKFIPDGILIECRAKADGLWRDGKPKRWYYALPMVLIWILSIVLIIKIFV